MITHPLFIEMMNEHKAILSLIANAESKLQEPCFKKLLIEIHEVAEQKHHHKEETLLFKKIYLNKHIHEGGPMCTFFYDFHMMERPRQKVEKIIQKELSIEPHQNEILITKCPLVIPIEEHQSGKDLLIYLIENFENLDPQLKKSYFELYKSIQVSHINKEENCLYRMCADLLSPQEADEILEEWKKAS